MAAQRKQIHPKPAQAEGITQVSRKDCDGLELSIEELEERIAPLWKRQYP